MSQEENLQHTSLYAFHLKNNARMVPFAGWEMPVQYTGIIEEHKAVRQKAGLFDVSHMGEALVSGPGAREFLDYVLTNDLSKLAPGKALYSPMCYTSGGVVDDLLVYCLSNTEFLLCLNASNTQKDINWLKTHCDAFDCTIEDVSKNYAQVALQGPDASSMLESLIPESASVTRFTFKIIHYENTPVIVSRTGYTGEDGFELYMSGVDAPHVVGHLWSALKKKGLQLVGLGARDSLRLEAGYPLYGHEISDSISPLQAGLNFAVKLKKESNFIGKEALLKESEQPPKQQIIFFKLEGRRIARQGAPILNSAGDPIGQVVSGTLSPILNAPIGSALVHCPYSESLQTDIRGHRIPLLITKPPFV